MSTIKEEILQANRNYVESFGEKGKLTIPPRRQTAILTCMDARIDPARFAGFAEGDFHVIRNAGGRASDDAIRSLVISHKLLGTHQWFVVHHTDCGMELFNNEVMSELLTGSLNTASLEGGAWKNVDNKHGSIEGRYINWLTISNLKDSVIEDVNRIRNHPLVSSKVSIWGFIYDVRSGKLIEVIESV